MKYMFFFLLLSYQLSANSIIGLCQTTYETLEKRRFQYTSQNELKKDIIVLRQSLIKMGYNVPPLKELIYKIGKTKEGRAYSKKLLEMFCEDDLECINEQAPQRPNFEEMDIDNEDFKYNEEDLAIAGVTALSGGLIAIIPNPIARWFAAFFFTMALEHGARLLKQKSQSNSDQGDNCSGDLYGYN